MISQRLSCARKALIDRSGGTSNGTSSGGICMPQEVCLDNGSKQFAEIFCSQREYDSSFLLWYAYEAHVVLVWW